ncbi:MAG: rRNA pseudouridine synthase [Neisseriaceae bacterium]|nr:rRNA pseudouridine synthase [Neisseriaceae bacterium]
MSTPKNKIKNSSKKNKAKKMVLRKPNKTIQNKSARLKEVRIPEERIGPQRLQKILAASGLGSRRDMENLIEAGKVEVNGKKAKLGDKVTLSDEVKVNNHAVKLIFPNRLPRIILYHKQEGEIVSREDPQGRTTVFDRIPAIKNHKWISIGRLDMNTSGLLIFTTSGELVNRFSHPRYSIDREYAVRVNGQLTKEQMDELVTEGIMLEDGIAKAAKISERFTDKENSKNFWYDIVVQEGRNREVRRIFEHYNLSVSRLIRTRFGPIAIPPRLKSGQYYELNELEAEYVLKEMGMLEETQRRFK